VSDWQQLLQTFGVAVVMLGFMGWCLVRVAIWVAPRLDRVFETFLRTFDESLHIEERLNRLEERIESLWSHILRSAATEAVSSGLASFHSPVTFSPETKALLDPIESELRTFYTESGHKMSDADLLSTIEQRWGTFILQNVCVQGKLSRSMGLLLALHIAVGDNKRKVMKLL
jgi:hypothetical protein